MNKHLLSCYSTTENFAKLRSHCGRNVISMARCGHNVLVTAFDSNRTCKRGEDKALKACYGLSTACTS